MSLDFTSNELANSATFGVEPCFFPLSCWQFIFYHTLQLFVEGECISVPTNQVEGTLYIHIVQLYWRTNVENPSKNASNQPKGKNRKGEREQNLEVFGWLAFAANGGGGAGS